MIASKNQKLKFPPEVAAAEQIEKRGPLMIDVSSIDAADDNPRQEFDELEALAASITRVSLLAPVSITPADPGRWRLVAGERRLRAAKLAGWRKIPAYEVIGPPDVLAEMTVAENLLRKDLNLMEQARAIELLNRPKNAGGVGMPTSEISQRLGKQDPWVRKMLGFLRLPPAWQAKLAAGELMFRQGVALTAYADRGDVLAAVLEDLQRNPEDWASSAGFDRSLAAVVERLDALAAAEAPAAASVSRGSAVEARPPVERRSALVRHDLVGVPGLAEFGGDPVAAIEPLIALLDTHAQIERVERLLRKRTGELAGR